MGYHGDFMTWYHDEGVDKVFRVELLKGKFTPQEEAEKYSDQEIYDCFHEYAKIREIIPLGEADKVYDYLIGFEEMCIDCNIVDGEYKYEIILFDEIRYYRLSQILLTDVTKQWNKETKDIIC